MADTHRRGRMERDGKWRDSTRRARLPRDWSRRRMTVLDRDQHVCRIADPGICAMVATEVDHIVSNDDHSLTNLQAVCGPCHKRKTQREARAGSSTQRRPSEPHPGLR